MVAALLYDLEIEYRRIGWGDPAFVYDEEKDLFRCTVAIRHYCGNCGLEHGPDDKFCPNCGRPVYRATKTPTPEADAHTPTAVPPSSSNEGSSEHDVVPSPQGIQWSATQVERPGESGGLVRVLAIAFIAAVIFGGCIAIGLSAEAAFWVLIVIGVLAYLGERSNRGRRKPPVRRLPTHSRSVPQWVKIAVATRDGGKCRRCGSAYELQYDHVIPYSRGGRSDDVNNIQLLCGGCNRLKGNRYVG